MPPAVGVSDVAVFPAVDRISAVAGVPAVAAIGASEENVVFPMTECPTKSFR